MAACIVPHCLQVKNTAYTNESGTTAAAHPTKAFANDSTISTKKWLSWFASYCYIG